MTLTDSRTVWCSDGSWLCARCAVPGFNEEQSNMFVPVVWFDDVAGVTWVLPRNLHAVDLKEAQRLGAGVAMHIDSKWVVAHAKERR